MSRLSIGIIGECMIELTGLNSKLKQGFGGDTLNTAIYLTRQIEPTRASVSYVTGLGKDPFSNAMEEAWREEGIKTDLIIRSNNRLPGMYYIEAAPDGERQFHYRRAESAARLWTSREGAQLVYQNMLKLTDIAFLTLDDEAALWGSASLIDVHRRCDHAGVHEVVIKRGQSSCLVLYEDETWEIPAMQLNPEYVRDTTAAGDSFSAGYLACRLRGGDVETSARQGHQLASRVIQHPGAIIPAELMPVNFEWRQCLV